MRRGPRATNCSYLAPLRRCAPLSPVDGRAPLASETPAPLSVVLAVLSSAAPLLSSPCHAVRFPGAVRVKVLDCLSSGSFWTPFW